MRGAFRLLVEVCIFFPSLRLPLFHFLFLFLRVPLSSAFSRCPPFKPGRWQHLSGELGHVTLASLSNLSNHLSPRSLAAASSPLVSPTPWSRSPSSYSAWCLPRVPASVLLGFTLVLLVLALPSPSTTQISTPCALYSALLCDPVSPPLSAVPGLTVLYQTRLSPDALLFQIPGSTCGFPC